MNIFSSVFSIIAGIGIFAYLKILKILKKRKEFERQERLIYEENLEKNRNSNINSESINFNKNEKFKLGNDFIFNEEFKFKVRKNSIKNLNKTNVKDYENQNNEDNNNNNNNILNKNSV